MNNHFYTTTQAAAILKVTPNTVARWCKAHKLKVRGKWGSQWLIDCASVEALAAERARPVVCVSCGKERGPGKRFKLCHDCQMKRNNARPLRKEGRR